MRISKLRLTRFWHENGIRWLALFGSILRDDFRPESDVEVLVEFTAGTKVGLSLITHKVQEAPQKKSDSHENTKNPRNVPLRHFAPSCENIPHKGNRWRTP